MVADDDPRPIPLFAKVRIIHASVTAGSLDPDTVDIYVTAPGTDISDESVAPTLTEVPYLANTGYLAVAEGTYDITVTVSGSRAPAIGPLQNVPLENGGVVRVALQLPDELVGLQAQQQLRVPLDPGARLGMVEVQHGRHDDERRDGVPQRPLGPERSRVRHGPSLRPPRR